MTDLASPLAVFATAFEDLSAHVEVAQVLDQLVLDVERLDYGTQAVDLEAALDAAQDELDAKRSAEIELRSELQQLQMERERDAKEAQALQGTWDAAFSRLATELREKEK